MMPLTVSMQAEVVVVFQISNLFIIIVLFFHFFFTRSHLRAKGL